MNRAPTTEIPTVTRSELADLTASPFYIVLNECNITPGLLDTADRLTHDTLKRLLGDNQDPDDWGFYGKATDV